jgi:hypothetical protein
MFQPKIENLIMVVLFILTIISGFNLIMDIKDNDVITLNFDLIASAMNTKNGSIVNDFLFSPVVLCIIAMILIIHIGLYVTNTDEVPVSFLYWLSAYLGIMSFFTLGNSYDGGVPFFVVIGMPIVLIIISMILMTITIYNYNKSSQKHSLYNRFIYLSNIDENNMMYYKITIIIEFIFIVLLLLFVFMRYGSLVALTKNENTILQSVLYSSLPIIYGLSGYSVFLGNKLSKIKFP